MATGPVFPSCNVKGLDGIEISDDDTIPRSVRIRQALRRLPDTGVSETKSVTWAIQETRAVELHEFRLVRSLKSSLRAGCVSLLGVDTSTWIAQLNERCEFRLVAKSWDGSMDPREFFQSTNKILELSGILNLSELSSSFAVKQRVR